MRAVARLCYTGQSAVLGGRSVARRASSRSIASTGTRELLAEAIGGRLPADGLEVELLIPGRKERTGGPSLERGLPFIWSPTRFREGRRAGRDGSWRSWMCKHGKPPHHRFRCDIPDATRRRSRRRGDEGSEVGGGLSAVPCEAVNRGMKRPIAMGWLEESKRNAHRLDRDSPLLSRAFLEARASGRF